MPNKEFHCSEFILVMVVTSSIPQPQKYHDFADKRTFFGFYPLAMGAMAQESTDRAYCEWSHRTRLCTCLLQWLLSSQHSCLQRGGLCMQILFNACSISRTM
ncbi:hypothetical protein AAHE18_13G344700 [Arachis hypogaea]